MYKLLELFRSFVLKKLKMKLHLVFLLAFAVFSTISSAFGQCNPNCNAGYQPICAAFPNDLYGRTIWNECILHFLECDFNQRYNIINQGECQPTCKNL